MEHGELRQDTLAEPAANGWLRTQGGSQILRLVSGRGELLQKLPEDTDLLPDRWSIQLGRHDLQQFVSEHSAEDDSLAQVVAPLKQRARVAPEVRDLYDLAPGLCLAVPELERRIREQEVGLRVPESLLWVTFHELESTQAQVSLQGWLLSLYEALVGKQLVLRRQSVYRIGPSTGANGGDRSWVSWWLRGSHLFLATPTASRCGIESPDLTGPAEVLLSGVPYAVDLNSEGAIDLTQSPLLLAELRAHEGPIEIVLPC